MNESEIKSDVVLTLHAAGKPLRSSEIAKQTGIPRGDVDKAVKELLDESLISSPRRSYYVPKV